jgi:hypothetical protein
MAWRPFEACVVPQPSGDNDRIKLHGFPPCCFVAAAMEDTMVDTTKRNRELVADPPAQRPRLCKSQMVGVGRSASAQQARLRCHELQVRAIAVAARFAQSKSAFIDMPSNGLVHRLFRPGAYSRRSDLLPSGHRRCGGRMSATPVRKCQVQMKDALTAAY